MSEKRGYVPLKEEGKKFIMDICSSKTEKTLLKGGNSWLLPHTNPITDIKEWECSVFDNGGKKIENDYDFGKALIKWYNHYSKIYEIDANVMVAQAHVESGLKCWNYSATGALGLTQFTPLTINEVIMNNRSGIGERFTQEEQNKINKDLDMSLNKYIQNSKNRVQLHKNVINNPKIMIKAQLRYMKYIAERRAANLTSSALFGYNRGPGTVRKNYLDSVESARLYGITYEGVNNYEMEGVHYVVKIFKKLYHNFNYTELKMDKDGMIDVGDVNGISIGNQSET